MSVATTDTINDYPNTDESELEHAHQMSPNNVYKNGSLIPIKGGELIAAIYQSILLKALQKLNKKKP